MNRTVQAGAMALATTIALAACAPSSVQGDLDAFNAKVKQLVDDFNGDVAGVSQGLTDLATVAQTGAVVSVQMAQKGCGAASILNGFYQVAAAISPKVAATAGDEAKAMNATDALCATPATDPASTLQVALGTVSAVKAAVQQDPAIAVALQAASVPPATATALKP
ncbi:MAG TPA: hypothetical protein VKU84_02620 [Stellaceae bacterium]|nr:hypothetical protein [Stellaceae bacterium]